MRWNSSSDVVQLASHLLPVDGEIWECGVYRGETAREFARLAATLQVDLRLFDTFTGRPELGPQDALEGTDFTDTSLKLAQDAVGVHSCWVHWHIGLIPYTFIGLEQCMISFAYIDLDLYQSTYDALSFIIPRLTDGGHILVDDYECGDTWPGVKRAVDQLVPRQCLQKLGSRVLIKSIG